MPSEKDEVSELLAGQVRELMKLVNETDIAELRIERGDLKLYISKKQHKDLPVELEEGDDQPVESEESPNSEEAIITATMVGRFYRGMPGKDPFVGSGSLIAKGQKVCVVESMKILNEISAEVDGQIEEILCEDGEVVEYGQPLFRVRLNPPPPLRDS